jgi:hypothetical protein
MHTYVVRHVRASSIASIPTSETRRSLASRSYVILHLANVGEFWTLQTHAPLGDAADSLLSVGDIGAALAMYDDVLSNLHRYPHNISKELPAKPLPYENTGAQRVTEDGQYAPC